MKQEDLIIDKVRKALAVADLLTQLLDTPILLSDTLPQIGNILTGYLKEIRDVIEEDDVSEYTENVVALREIDSSINDEIIMPIQCLKCHCEFTPKNNNQYYCPFCRQQKTKLCKTCGQKFTAEGREQRCDSCRQNKVKQIKAKYQNPNQLDEEIDKWLGVEEKND